MTEQESNKAAVRRFYDEVWNRGNYAVATEIFTTTPDGRRDHGNIGPIVVNFRPGSHRDFGTSVPQTV